MSAKIEKMSRESASSNGRERDGRESTERSSKKSKTVHAEDSSDLRDGVEKPAKKSRISRYSEDSSAQVQKYAFTYIRANDFQVNRVWLTLLVLVSWSIALSRVIDCSIFYSLL
jgi:hypothetical protein